MGGDVLVQLLDRESLVSVSGGQGVTSDRLAVLLATHHLHLSPPAIPLFAFKQGTRWLSASEVVVGEGPVQLRLRWRVPEWRARGRASNIRGLDPVAFRYLYAQVRRDFGFGLVTRREREKWWQSRSSKEEEKREEEKKEEGIHIAELMGFVMAIDVIDGRTDRKQISAKNYLPKDKWSSLASMDYYFAKFMLGPKALAYTDKLLKAEQPKMESTLLKEEFLRRVELYFPAFFAEAFPGWVEDGARETEVRLVVAPPQEDAAASLTMVRRTEGGSASEPVCSVPDICNISLREDGASMEVSRKTGIPVYLRLASAAEAASLLALLCGYYRLGEKWTFSLCSELRWPRLEELLEGKVHGPVTAAWAEKMLRRKAALRKGAYLVRESEVEVGRLALHYIAHDGCRPEEVPIVTEGQAGCARYRLAPTSGPPLPATLTATFATVGDLVKALRSVPSHIEISECLHPSEFDRCSLLLPCRTDSQWREDKLRGPGAAARERVVINPRSLSKHENTVRESAMCKLWQGEWRRQGGVRETVAIKQLNRSLVATHTTAFVELARRCLEWDDGSLAAAAGLCLPCHPEPPALVTEWFPLGSLSSYLATHRTALQPVDLLEAATCLARALYYLDDQGLVHGEVRARNLMVAAHTDAQFQVKLCEGGLAGPHASDVHWLDFQQLREAAAGEPVVPSKAGDVWSFATTLWEIFSGCAMFPLAGAGALEAAARYLEGYRLPLPRPACPVYPLMRECWAPQPQARKRPHEIYRDVNQLFYKVFNGRRVHDYVTIEDTAVSTPATLTPGHASTSSLATSAGGLVPMFTDVSRKLLDLGGYGSCSPLLAGSSRSGSSLAGSLFTDISGVTDQTSLDWGSSCGGGLYSISSIYQLNDCQIEYQTEYPLGEGNFGVVYKGVRTRTDGEWEQVAIKKVKDTDSMSGAAVDDMEREVSVMKKLSHDNIVKIVGVLQDGPSIIIVMEYLREGSLDRYLQTNRYMVDFKQLFGYSQNIVDGMEYLTQNQIIHRDLAARNILVADQETVKISDFGLARQGDCYVMSSATTIPVKWEALECLTHRKYSHKSDVWSFGVTLWEMFAYGRSPTMEGCEEYFTSSPERSRQDYKDWLAKLEAGQRLPRTDVCPEFLYSRVMLRCWQKDPSSRPTFQQLKQELKKAELEVT